MADEPAKRQDWAVPFLARLCVCAWVCAILYETFDFFKPIRMPCLLFGFWSSVLALVNGLFLLFIRRQGIFFVFVLISILPTIHFGFVARNIAVQRNIIDPTWFGGTVPIDSIEREVAPDQVDIPDKTKP